MNEFTYRLYCFIHSKAKRLLRRSRLSEGGIFTLAHVPKGVSKEGASELWQAFIEGSKIEESKEFKDFLYAGYIEESQKWCLSSWIWTNAAIIRAYCSINEVEKAKKLASKLATKQQDCGGWIVRNDYDKKGVKPMLAPNDSAYIANNAFIELYLITKEVNYLEIAQRCAEWIIETSRSDGLVYTGFNVRDYEWDKECIIVDTGFTAGLFARLYNITSDNKYKVFLEKFVKRYIDLFYISANKGFCTSIGRNDKHQGGMFGRGQAWALEGLIPAYRILKDNYIKEVIESTINNLIHVQCTNGGWPYNFSHPLMGEDCKAVSVIAKNMMEWYAIVNDERIKESALKALDWCRKHTNIEGEAKGGIFSFCLEGAVVHDLYTSCAFVYASAYAIELNHMLKK